MPRETGRFHAGPNHDVVSIEGGEGYCKTPCAECPWRLDSPIGAFPADAYRHSARTATDMATSSFACHMAGLENPKTCAGFLLRGATHNMRVRMKLWSGEIDMREVSSEVELYENYRAMAEANGVPPDDESLRNVRDDV